MYEENWFEFKEEDFVVEKAKPHNKKIDFSSAIAHIISRNDFFNYQTVLQFSEGCVGEYCSTFVTHSYKERDETTLSTVWPTMLSSDGASVGNFYLFIVHWEGFTIIIE